MTKSRKILFRFIALSLGILVSLIVLELFLKLYNPFGFRLKGDRIILPSHQSFHLNNERIPGIDSFIVHDKNSMGFRGPEFPERSEDFLKVIAVGGSTTECLHLSNGNDWVSLLGEKLKNDVPNLWINNAGFSGHSTFGHQILLEDYVSSLKPDYVFYLVGINDIERKDLDGGDNSILRKSKNWKSYLRNNSEIANLLINLRRYLYVNEKELNDYYIDFENIIELDSISHSAIEEMSERQTQFLQEYESRLNRLLKTSTDNDITPILITQPTLVGFGIDKQFNINLAKGKICSDFGGAYYWKRLELYNEVTRKVALQKGVQLIDLANSLPKSTVNFYDCIHFTNRGAENVADIVYIQFSNTLDSIQLR